MFTFCQAKVRSMQVLSKNCGITTIWDDTWQLFYDEIKLLSPEKVHKYSKPRNVSKKGDCAQESRKVTT